MTSLAKQYGTLAPASKVPPSVNAVADKLLAGTSEVYALRGRGTLVYYLAVSSGHVCGIVAVDGAATAGGCYRSALDLAEGKAGLTISVVANGFRIVAPVPNGSRDAVIEWAGGKQEPLLISGNLVTTVVKQLPKRISWTSGDGTPREFVVGDDLLTPPA
jgi:hypothetical protein